MMMPKITAAQPRIKPASARPAPCSPLRLIWCRAMWPNTIAGMVASGPNVNCATPQTRLAIASPLVLTTGVTPVALAEAGGEEHLCRTDGGHDNRHHVSRPPADRTEGVGDL